FICVKFCKSVHGLSRTKSARQFERNACSVDHATSGSALPRVHVSAPSPKLDIVFGEADPPFAWVGRVVLNALATCSRGQSVRPHVSYTRATALWPTRDHLLCRLAEFNLITYFLDLRRLLFDSCGKRCNLVLELLHSAMLFEELIEQHRVHHFVVHALRLAFSIARHEIGVHLCHFLSNEAKGR